MNRRHAAIAVALCLAALALLVWKPRTSPGTQPPAAEEAQLPPGVQMGLAAAVIPAKSDPGEEPAQANTPTQASGVVRDAARGGPVAGAMLHVTRDSIPVAETKTDAKGEFALPCRNGDLVEVTARGYRPHKGLLPCKDLLRYELGPSVTLEGHVFAPDGSPAAEAKVACTEGVQTRPRAETVTGDDGAFSVSCGMGDLRLSAHHGSGAPAWKDLGVQPAGTIRTGIVLRIGKGRTLTGQVRSASGAPSAARVLLLDGEDWRRPTLLPTDAEGKFAAIIGSDTHTVAAIDDQGRTVSATVAAGTGSPAPLVLTLPEWLTLRGRLVGDSTDARVTAHRDRQTMSEDEPARIREIFGILLTRGSYFRSAKVDGSRFTVEGVEPGNYSLMAASKTASGEATASTSSSGEIVIVMRPTANLDLHVRWDDGRMGEGMVQIEGGDSSRMQPLRDGTTRATGLAVEPHEISFLPKEGVVPRPIRLPIVAGENTFTWAVPSASITVEGLVLDAESGNPIPGAQVSTPLEDWYGWSKGGSFVLTADDGRFKVQVATLDAAVFVFHEGHVSQVVPASQATIVRLQRGEESDQVQAPDFEERWKAAKEREAAKRAR